MQSQIYDKAQLIQAFMRPSILLINKKFTKRWKGIIGLFCESRLQGGIGCFAC